MSNFPSQATGLASRHVSVGKAAVDGPASGPLASVLQPLVDQHSVAGAVMLVANRQKVLALEAVGYADVESKRPMRTDDFFWIASMTKPMTAVAVMMLVDEGKVSLDDPVEKYLPDFKGIKVNTSPQDSPAVLVPASHPFTLRECLWHGAGLPFSSAFEKPKYDVHPLAERVDSYAKEPLINQPGTKFQYSNEGLNIAGRIVEIVSGEPYEKFLQDRLFTPLGMTDTTFWPSKEQVARLATSYEEAPDKKSSVPTIVSQLQYPLDGPGRYPIPGGGLFSTASDVANFCLMIANQGTWAGHTYLSEKSWQEMRTRQSVAGPDNVGVGWRLDKASINHGGAYQTKMTIDFEHDLILIFMVQQRPPWPNGVNPDEVFSQAAVALLGKKSQA